MTTTARPPVRTATYDEIKPLLALCKAGKLFEVQDWIAAGKPVNPPPAPAKGQYGKTPLVTAIEHGFHSLVKVLLEGGAVIEPEGWRSPMSKALELRRLDLAQLLVDHGHNPAAVNMSEVFNTWDPEMMEYFIDRGADVETNRPLAEAFSYRIRTALRIFKKYKERFPSFQEQANVALRHHCKEGNLKWISLMLWAGADPYIPGAGSWDDEYEEGAYGLSALGYAALYRHFEVFGLKGVRLDPTNPAMHEIVRHSGRGEGEGVLTTLLNGGLNPNDQENGGCSAIQDLLTDMSWYFTLNSWDRGTEKGSLDTTEARQKLKIIHLLANHGAKWIPTESEINYGRRSLLKLVPDYTVEFVWIMSKYKSCSRETVQTLMRTPSIKRHTAKYARRLLQLVSSWPSEMTATQPGSLRCVKKAGSRQASTETPDSSHPKQPR